MKNWQIILLLLLSGCGQAIEDQAICEELFIGFIHRDVKASWPKVYPLIASKKTCDEINWNKRYSFPRCNGFIQENEYTQFWCYPDAFMCGNHVIKGKEYIDE